MKKLMAVLMVSFLLVGCSGASFKDSMYAKFVCEGDLTYEFTSDGKLIVTQGSAQKEFKYTHIDNGVYYVPGYSQLTNQYVIVNKDLTKLGSFGSLGKPEDSKEKFTKQFNESYDFTDKCKRP